VEPLERPDDGDRCDEVVAGLQQRERDPPEHLPAAGPVDRRRLVDLARDRLERREVEEHEGPGRRPGVQEDYRVQGRVRVADPVLVRREAEQLEDRIQPERAADAVEQPVRLREEDPQDGHGGRGCDRRKVERRPEERPSAELLVDEDGEEQADGHRQRHPADRVVDRVLDRPDEDRVLEDVLVVGDSDERPGAAPDVPLEDADEQGVQDRADVQHQEQEHRDRDERVGSERLGSLTDAGRYSTVPGARDRHPRTSLTSIGAAAGAWPRLPRSIPARPPELSACRQLASAASTAVFVAAITESALYVLSWISLVKASWNAFWTSP